MPVSAIKSNVTFSDKPPNMIYWGKQKLSFGQMWVGTDEDGAVCILDFAQKLAEWQSKWPKTKFVKTTQKSGKNAKIRLCGTKFQQKVWKALLDIPRGKSISYAEMAKRIGKPKAARAVGNALGANPVPILIPCHRVIAGNGAIGGYSGGIAIKKRLLHDEGSFES